MHKLIINFAPTGMVPTKQMTPHVPISPREIIEDAVVCVDLGASIVHLHARQEDGQPTYRKDIYARIIEGIRQRNNQVIVCVSTSGRTYNEFEKRAEALDLDGPCKPDMASLTLSSLNFPHSASVNAPEMIVALLKRMNERGIKPELEVFDLGMINYAKYLIRKGLLQPPYYFNILLGNIAGAQATLSTLALMLQELPSPCAWALAGLGDCQQMVTSLSVLLGGHVRIGLEDNIYFDPQRTCLATNAMLIGRLTKLAAAAGVPLATPAETRALLGLASVVGQPAARTAPSMPAETRTNLFSNISPN